MQPAPASSIQPAVSLLEKTPVLFETMLRDLSGELLHWKPAADRWSISEVLAHLSHLEHVYAERALRMRGLSVDAADVPASARAVLLADELEAVSRAAFLAHRMTAEDPGSDPGLPPELRAAVDQAADDWPGGAGALVTAIADAALDTFALLARPLSQRPDPAVALAARRARPGGHSAGCCPVTSACTGS